MKEFLITLIGSIGFVASLCILFYPQETDRQRAVKSGTYVGNFIGVITMVAIILKLFS